MRYTTYENRHNPHITIHVPNCSQLRKNGGEGIGEYKEHETLDSAHKYAQTTGLPIRECAYCMK
jgi:hypothetical protein